MNLSELQVYVMCHNTAPNSFLSRWLSGKKLDWKRGSQVGFSVDVARNQTINQFLLDDVPRGKKHLLMLDHDMVPTIQTTAMLADPHELIFSRYVCSGGCSHSAETVPAGCFRISATLLQQFQKPVFKVTTNENRDLIVGCECLHFNMQLKSLGIEPKHVADIGHQQGGDAGIVFFPSTNRLGYEFCWPNELPYSEILTHGRE